MELNKLIPSRDIESIKVKKKWGEYKALVQKLTANAEHIQHLSSQHSSSSACSKPLSYSVLYPMPSLHQNQATFPPPNLDPLPSLDENHPGSSICEMSKDNTLIFRILHRRMAIHSGNYHLCLRRISLMLFSFVLSQIWRGQSFHRRTKNSAIDGNSSQIFHVCSLD